MFLMSTKPRQQPDLSPCKDQRLTKVLIQLISLQKLPQDAAAGLCQRVPPRLHEVQQLHHVHHQLLGQLLQVLKRGWAKPSGTFRRIEELRISFARLESGINSFIKHTILLDGLFVKSKKIIKTYLPHANNEYYLKFTVNFKLLY